MRRRFGRLRGRKRSVAWIPGFSSYDDPNGVSNRLLTFAAVPNTTTTWAVAVQLTTDADLTLHGGEDAVIERIRGRVVFVEGRKNAGAGLAAYGFQVRLVVAQCEILPAGGAGSPPFNQSFVTSADMGNDAILWNSDTVVSPTAIGGAGAGYENMVGNLTQWLDVDIRAKRKLQSNSQIVMFMQSCFPAGTTGADMRFLGGLRMLLKRPR